MGLEEGAGGDKQGDRAGQQDGGGLLVPHGHPQRPHRAPGSQGRHPPQLQVRSWVTEVMVLYIERKGKEWNARREYRGHGWIGNTSHQVGGNYGCQEQGI